MKYSQIKASSGYTQLGLLLSLIFGGVIFYFCWQVVPFYYYYYDLQGLMQAQANKAQVLTDVQIRENLMEHIEKIGIPIDREDDLIINRSHNLISISLDYSEVLYVDLGEDRVYDLHIFHFQPHAESTF